MSFDGLSVQIFVLFDFSPIPKPRAPTGEAKLRNVAVFDFPGLLSDHQPVEHWQASPRLTRSLAAPTETQGGPVP